MIFLLFSMNFSFIVTYVSTLSRLCESKKPLAGLLSHRCIGYSVLEEIAMEIPAVVDRPAARAKVHLREQGAEQIGLCAAD